MPSAEIRRLIDELREACRYVRKHSEVAVSSIQRIEHELSNIPSPTVDRLVNNLGVARRFIQVEPDVAQGYLAGAAFELESLESRSK